jgi:hypothetical protein
MVEPVESLSLRAYLYISPPCKDTTVYMELKRYFDKVFSTSEVSRYSISSEPTPQMEIVKVFVQGPNPECVLSEIYGCIAVASVTYFEKYGHNIRGITIERLANQTI